MPGKSKGVRAGKARGDADADRHLQLRADGGYRYVRRVPKPFWAFDSRGFVRRSLKTSDLREARLRRDAMEAADDAFWLDLAGDISRVSIERRYEAARRRATMLKLHYAPADELLAASSIDVLQRRLDVLERALSGGRGENAARAALESAAAGEDDDDARGAVAAVLGSAAPPVMMFSAAYDVYLDEIEAAQRRRKSPAQYASWRKVKLRAKANFLAVVGDKPFDEVGRGDALVFWRWCEARVAAGEWRANSAARDFGNIRKAWAAYTRHLGRDGDNPFRELVFARDRQRQRPPFETAWIVDAILHPGALAGLNEEARDIILALVETGCRPSEICNLSPARIMLAAEVPHLVIAPEDGLEIKTESSIRNLPLVGVSLAAMKRHPEGFPRYRDRATLFSDVANKFFRENGLFPTPEHSIYSFRHSFEKRMTEGGIDEGLRRILMGHALDRPRYGDGGSLAWRREQLLRIALPFDRAVFRR